MKIYVVGSTKNKFLPLNNIRTKFLINVKHNEDNIDFLNPWYCELTGLYHLWKNCNDDIVGLEHYRRYFVNGKNKILSEQEVLNILKDNDVICKKYFFKTKYNGTGIYRGHGWLKILYKFISNIDDEELQKYTRVYLMKKYEAQCNMFICKKEIINKYCDELFSILTKFEAREFYNIPRIIGYLAESFFGAWLEYNGYKIYYNRVRQI